MIWNGTGLGQSSHDCCKSFDNADIAGQSVKRGTLLPTGDWTSGRYNNSTSSRSIGGGGSGAGTSLDKPLGVRGRSASEPSFLSASRAVKVRVSSPAPSNSRSSYTPPAVKGERFLLNYFPRLRPSSLSFSPIIDAVCQRTGQMVRMTQGCLCPSLVHFQENPCSKEYLKEIQKRRTEEEERKERKKEEEKEKQVFQVFSRNDG